MLIVDKPIKKRRKAMGILHLPKDVTSNATYKNWKYLWRQYMIFETDKGEKEYVFTPEVTERFISYIVKSMKKK
jgi:hypothetical protein